MRVCLQGCAHPLHRSERERERERDREIEDGTERGGRKSELYIERERVSYRERERVSYRERERVR